MSADKTTTKLLNDCIETLVIAVDYIEAIAGSDDSETLKYLDKKLKQLDKKVKKLTPQ